ncbi:MAG: hypothetical protein IT168_00750 [Bryobacterales bacterium]|nr:hypothetical protein [Bryobacterales bacterium]
MNKAVQFGRAALAMILIAALTGFVLSAAAAACPLVKAKAPCCPKNQPNHCPKSTQTVKTCPFALTEAKLAVLKAKADAMSAPAPLLSATSATAALVEANRWVPPAPVVFDLYLHNRTLLI